MNSTALTSGIAQAIRMRTAIPPIDRTLSLEQAYELQQAVTKLRDPDGGGGIKAGVTAKGAQQHFGVDQPLIGSLYSNSRLGDGCRLPNVQGRMLECELAVVVDAQGKPKAIAPAIEVVLVQFSRPEDMTAANLVASNLGADCYIVGEFRNWLPPIAEATVTLKRGDETINQSSTSESLGGPEHSVPWICKEAVSRGIPIHADTLLMTGACGKVVPAEVGIYRADFGSFGEVQFEISEPA